MMNETEKTWAEQAQDILEAGLKQAQGGTTGGSQGACERYMAGEICKMLERFCYQSEDFAKAVVDRRGTLGECVSGIVGGHWPKGVSDVEAYAEAVKYYMPGAKVRATFRIDAPVEEDNDLLDLNGDISNTDGVQDDGLDGLLCDNTPEERQVPKSQTDGNSGGAIILDLFGTGEA